MRRSERRSRRSGTDSFAVVTIGFDTRNDTPERMRAFARAQGIDRPGWRFLSGDARTVEALAEQVGFVVYPAPQGFDHMALTTVVDQEGRIYRQIYGGVFEAPAVVEPLKARPPYCSRATCGALGERLRQRFEIRDAAELAVEIDPRRLTRETVGCARRDRRQSREPRRAGSQSGSAAGDQPLAAVHGRGARGRLAARGRHRTASTSI